VATLASQESWFSIKKEYYFLTVKKIKTHIHTKKLIKLKSALISALRKSDSTFHRSCLGLAPVGGGQYKERVWEGEYGGILCTHE
jgi:hypothetical protein